MQQDSEKEAMRGKKGASNWEGDKRQYCEETTVVLPVESHACHSGLLCHLEDEGRKEDSTG
jgi:hypothetical protein